MILQAAGPAYLSSLQRVGKPVVLVSHVFDGLECPVVLPDNRGGLHQAVAHLVAHGHRRIGLVVGDPVSHRATELLAGYTEAMAAAGLSADPAWTELTAERLPGAPVTAVLCADRTQTAAALHALAGKHDQPAIVGFGDFELSDLVSPPVSVLVYDSVLIGRTAGELLVRRLAGEEAPPRTVHVPVTLITRPG